MDLKKENYIKTLSKISPEGCDLKVGDLVEWVNDNGVVWKQKILGFDYDDFNKKYKKYVILDKESYWFPLDHTKLKLIKR